MRADGIHMEEPEDSGPKVTCEARSELHRKNVSAQEAKNH